MTLKSSDLISLFEQALAGVHDDSFQEIGIVIQVGDNICRAFGLKNAVFGELVTFERGNKGIILNLDENFVSIFLLDTTRAVDQNEVVKRSGSVFQIPLSDQLLGRVVDAMAQPIDMLGEIKAQDYRPVEITPPGIVERKPINQSLETGIMAVDALVPIGKGQRELIIGNRSTGKTSLAIDTILHQRDKNVVCVYVSIAQRQALLARTIKTLADHGAIAYTTVVAADASEAVLRQYLAPYVGCTIAEYFCRQGRDVLIVYDDLSNHAIAYREMSLLLRRSPGREAYPGDVFYLHSRLLERAGNFVHGGSLTALPIVQIQGDDITSYIPTNLISITDGQIFLDSHLFNQGIRPAVNVELSVSRVGGAAQTKAIKKMTKALRLELAQYHELLDFTQFGTELDPVAQKKLARGTIAVQLLKQAQLVGYSFVDQTLMLFLLKENYLDRVPSANVSTYARQFVSYVKSVYSDIYESIAQTADFDEHAQKQVTTIAEEFSKIYIC